MPKYVIERELPGAGKLTSGELQADFTEILQRVERHGTADPVGAELCHRRQGVLRLHRTE